jgi:hypothetical protein
MSMRNERPDPIDALIDEAARRLVAGEPSSALRRGVRDRLDRRRPVWSLVPVWGAAAAALVAVVFAARIFLAAPDRPDSVVATDRPSTVKSGAQLATRAAPAVIQPESSDARQVSRRRAAALPLPPPEEEPLIPPITIEPLTTAQIAVNESSGPMPIEIEPLQIEPLLGQ